MHFTTPHLMPDPQRSPFWVGSEEQDAAATVRCPTCASDVMLDVCRFLSRAERWHDGLPEPLQESVSTLFGLQREARADPWPGRIRGGRVDPFGSGCQPSVGPLVCSNCKDAQLVCLDFYESQPSRYAAVLHGLAASTKDAAAAVTPNIPVEGLRLALPLADGTVLLDFLLDGPRWLSPDAVMRLSPAFFQGEVGASDFHGIKTIDGGRIDIAQLHAQSATARGLAQDAIALALSHLSFEPDDEDPKRYELAASWRPLRRIKAFRVEDAKGSGFLVYGKRNDFDINQTPEALVDRLELSNASAGWAHKAIDSGFDTFDGLHRLTAAVVARGKHCENAIPVNKAASLPQPPSTVSEAWWGPEGEPQAHFVAKGDSDEVLSEQLAMVIARMHERRDADHVGSETRLSVVAIAKSWRLELCWLDPDASSSFGDRAYSLVLRHLAGTMNEDNFEYLGKRLALAVVARPEFADLELFHRFEMMRKWKRLGAD